MPGGVPIVAEVRQRLGEMAADLARPTDGNKQQPRPKAKSAAKKKRAKAKKAALKADAAPAKEESISKFEFKELMKAMAAGTGRGGGKARNETAEKQLCRD